MVTRFHMPFHAAPLAAAGLLLLGCSGSGRSEIHGIGEPPVPIALNFVVVPTLETDTQDPFKPWVMTAGQQVQIHAIDSVTGQQVDDKVKWVISPWKFATDPIGTIDQTGKYTAPSSPSGVVLSVGTSGPPTAYQGAKYISIRAATVTLSDAH